MGLTMVDRYVLVVTIGNRARLSQNFHHDVSIGEHLEWGLDIGSASQSLSWCVRHIEGVIVIMRSGGHENGPRQGYGIHAIAASIYRPDDRHGLQCHGSSAI